MAERLYEHRLADIRLLGYSVAGEETVIAAPELNCCFDVGKSPAEILAIDHILLSHGHMDHAAGIAYYFSQRNFVGNAAGTLLCPSHLVDPFRDLMKAWARIERHPSPANIVAAEPDKDFEIRKGLIARPFAVNHGYPSLGYTLLDVRHKLRPEFADRTGPQLVELKKQGVEIQHRLEVPLVAFCGDTAEGNFLALDHVRRAKVLIMECTFIEEDHVRRAREGYHMHVRDLARILPKMENEWFLLTHLSRRTAMRDARKALARLVDDSVMGRVKFLMEGQKVGSRPPPMKDENAEPRAT